MSVTYWKRFEAGIITRLGGVEMADEFFAIHPKIKTVMVGSARYHHGKRGASWKAASIFFAQVIQPILKADRVASQKIKPGI